MLNLPLVYILLNNDVSPTYVYAFQIIFDVVILIYRINYLHNQVFFSVKRYYVDVILKILLITVVAIISMIFIKALFCENWQDLVLSIIVSIIIYSIGTWALLMNVDQRTLVCKYIADVYRNKRIGPTR